MHSISVLNMKGGVAKTTLATNVADYLARREQSRVLLIDLDPQFNATQCLLSGEEYIERRKGGGHTIVNIFDDSPPPLISAVHRIGYPTQPKLNEIVPWEIRNGLHLLAGDLELYRLDMGTGQGREQRIKRYLEATKAVEKYDFVIIDTPPTPSHWMWAALLASDGYLVPVKPEPLSRTGIDLLKSVVDRCALNFGHTVECFGVVLTIVEANTKVFKETKEFLDDNATWKGKRFASFLTKRTALASGQGNQQMILDLQDNGIKLELANIVKEFLERVK